MKTEIITVSSDLEGREEAIKAAEKFAEDNGFSGKSETHFRLLAEESVCMIHGIMDNFKGKFWIEGEKTDEGMLCRIHISANKCVDMKQEDQLLSVSTTGKNESAKGILGKIREAFRICLQHPQDDAYFDQYSSLNSWYGMGPGTTESMSSAYMDSQLWSLGDYRRGVYESKNESKEEWDELEKSIIAKLADDVKVFLRNDTTEVVIEKLVV